MSFALSDNKKSILRENYVPRRFAYPLLFLEKGEVIGEP